MFKNSSWKLIKNENLRKKSTVQVLCSSHLSSEQVLCCCQVDVHPCSSSMRATTLERSRGTEHNSWDFQRQQSPFKHTSDAGIPLLPRAIVPAEGSLTQLEGWQSIPAAPAAARSHKEPRQTSSGTAEELLDQSLAHPAVLKLRRSNSQRNIQTTAAPLRSTQTGITSFTLST